MIVKICGLMSGTDAAYANEAEPDWAGFVLHEGSRRCVSPDTAREMRAVLDPSIVTVAVTVDRDPSVIGRLVDDGTVGMVQIHGNDDPAYHRRIADLGVPVIEAFVVRTREDVEKAASCEADHILLDAGAGSGKTFDWSLLEDVQFPYILSGGLNPDNVAQAVERLSPEGVDVSSGVETGGVKDPSKMTAFVNAARKVRDERDHTSPPSSHD